MTSTATATVTRPGVPPAPGREDPTWTLTTTGGHTLTGHLPAWADEDPSESGIPLELLGTRLADISHRTTFPGQPAKVVLGSAPAQDAEILWASIDCHPYAAVRCVLRHPGELPTRVSHPPMGTAPDPGDGCAIPSWPPGPCR
ncbi:DUF6907 domain-containing protein [Peterkaempfera bronchialis]|uniref:DUF6907 domain-containing protein n=1 Tax=Peterkaempfera bronchialis TaxID=2126346 RepID=UPI0026AAA402